MPSTLYDRDFKFIVFYEYIKNKKHHANEVFRRFKENSLYSKIEFKDKCFDVIEEAINKALKPNMFIVENRQELTSDEKNKLEIYSSSDGIILLEEALVLKRNIELALKADSIEELEKLKEGINTYISEEDLPIEEGHSKEDLNSNEPQSPLFKNKELETKCLNVLKELKYPVLNSEGEFMDSFGMKGAIVILYDECLRLGFIIKKGRNRNEVAEEVMKLIPDLKIDGSTFDKNPKAKKYKKEIKEKLSQLSHK